MENLAKSNWTDPERVQEFAKTYSSRYGDDFWTSLNDMLPELSRPIVADFGCGPGLWLADAIGRFQASKAYGFDASKAMLDYAGEVLQKIATGIPHELHEVNFDTDPIPLSEHVLDLAFGGYMLHEVADPDSFLHSLSMHIRRDGVCIIFDFISGNQQEFIHQMVARGMPEERARMRYPHMCKHSVDDIEKKMKDSGFMNVRAKKIKETRAIIVGIKA